MNIKFQHFTVILFITLLLITGGITLADPGAVYSELVTSIKITPESGKAGSEVIVSGINFPGTLATIYWDKRVIAQKVPIADDGKFSFMLVIPEASKGSHIIGVMDNSHWEGAASESTFTISPNIRVFPDVIDATSSLTVYGTGFGDRETGIKVLLDGKLAVANNLKSDMQGNWSTIVSFHSSLSKGRHSLSVVANSSPELTGKELGFIVAPWLEMKPSTGPVGTQLLIYGWGLRGNEDGITVTMDNEIIFTNIRAEVDGTIKLDGSKREFGSFLSGADYRESIYVPDTTQGKHIIGVYGSSFTPKGTFPDYPFTVTSSLTLDPKSGKEAAIVNVTGTGFSSGESVSLKYDGKDTGTALKADQAGKFVVQYTIPQSTKQDHTFAATGDKGNSANATFTLEKEVAAAVPTLVAPANGIQLATFKSVGDVYLGSFEYIGGLFDYLSGSQPIKKSIIITTLKWSIQGESGPWTYNVQVARDRNFSSLVVDKTVNSTDYNFIPGDTITNGRYFWRVKGIDIVGTGTNWSDVSQFEVVSMSSHVGWISLLILVLAIAAIVVIILVVRTVIARSRY